MSIDEKNSVRKGRSCVDDFIFYKINNTETTGIQP